jgi:hypothetical protein
MAGLFSQDQINSIVNAGVTGSAERAQAAQTGAGAQLLNAQGTSAFNLANAAEVAKNAAAQRALQGANTGLLGAQTLETQTSTKEIAPNAASHRAFEQASGANAQSQADTTIGNRNDTVNANLGVNKSVTPQGVAGQTGQQRLAPNTSFPTGLVVDPTTSLLAPITTAYNAGVNLFTGPAGARGMIRVPGKGDGSTDTYKTKLAPGEAVLNKGAAEHIGRDTIAVLNTIGRAKMGMVNPEVEGVMKPSMR